MPIIIGLLVWIAGCGTPDAPGPDDLGARGLGDGHVQSCVTVDDCDDFDPCTNDICQSNRTCSSSRKCAWLDDDCNTGTCLADARCTKTVVNEGKSCGAGGLCIQGVCELPKPCKVSSTLGCEFFHKQRNDKTTGLGSMSDYACVTGAAGPEMVYLLNVPTRRSLSLSLTNTTAALDLIVIEGSTCSGTAACKGSSLIAEANTDYLVIVDGKTSGSYTLSLDCGDCSSAPALACNSSVAGDTTSAASSFAGYLCAQNEPGPEQSWKITPAKDQTYNLKLSGMTRDLDLVVLSESGGACDPQVCQGYSQKSGILDEAVSFQGYASANYYVMVDGKGALGSPYALEVRCADSCRNPLNQLACAALESDTRGNDDSARSRDVIDSWSCASNTTGPEVVYSFSPQQAGNYTVSLTGLGADLDLIVTEGNHLVCDSLSVCLASGTQTGTASETVTFAAQAGHLYWIAVDGKNGAVSPYTIAITNGCV